MLIFCWDILKGGVTIVPMEPAPDQGPEFTIDSLSPDADFIDAMRWTRAILVQRSGVPQEYFDDATRGSHEEQLFDGSSPDLRLDGSMLDHRRGPKLSRGS